MHIQEPFLGNRDISHSGFNLYWPAGTDNLKDMRVLVAVKKDILSKVIIENQTDLVSHPYCMVFDIRELRPQSRRYLRRTRVVNLYDNKVGRDQLWQGPNAPVRRAIQDIPWGLVIRGRVLIVGDMNAHSNMWNPHCRQKQNAGLLEEIIETYDLIVNNDTDFPTRPASRGISIIDLALISPDLNLVQVWEIPEENPSLSDHEPILLEWEDIKGQENPQSAMKGWNIENLLQDEKLLNAGHEDWKMASQGRNYLTTSSTKEDLDKEVEWFESRLIGLLDNHAKITRGCAYFKRWWNEDVAEARKSWAKSKRKFGRDEISKNGLKQPWNFYYRTIRKAKRLSWQNFLQGGEENIRQQSQVLDQNRCWTALKYTKPLQFRITPALKDPDGNIATSMKTKEAFVYQSAFSKPSRSLEAEPVITHGVAHQGITENKVYLALVTQAISKAPGPNKINFRILCTVWNWDKERMTNMV